MSGRWPLMPRGERAIAPVTVWPGTGCRGVSGDRALGRLDELVKKGRPEWVDRCWLQIGLIRESDGRIWPRRSRQSAHSSGMHLRARSCRRPSFTMAWPSRGSAGRETPWICCGRWLRTGRESIGPRRGAELATIQLAGLHFEEATATLESALKRYPKCPGRARLEFRSGRGPAEIKRLAEAEARFLKVAEVFPDDAWADDAMLRAAQSALERGDFTTARRLAGRSRRGFDQSELRIEAAIDWKRGRCLHRVRPQDAVAIFESLVGPERQTARKPAARPRRARQTPASKKAEARALPTALARSARYDLALAYRALGDRLTREAILAKLANEQAGPITADAQFLVGQSHLDAGRIRGSRLTARSILAANPRGDVAEFAIAHLVMARLGLGQTDAAWKMSGPPCGEVSRKARAWRRHGFESPRRRSRLTRPTAPWSSSSSWPAEQKRGPGGPSSSHGQTGRRDRSGALGTSYRGLGKALAEFGKPAEAAAAFGQCTRLAPDEPTAAAVALARHVRSRTATKWPPRLKAYSLFRTVTRNPNQAALAASARARLLRQGGRHGEASGELERLIGDEHGETA